MIWFVVGVLVGAGAAMSVLGFLIVKAEDEERQEMARKQLEKNTRNYY